MVAFQGVIVSGFRGLEGTQYSTQTLKDGEDVALKFLSQRVHVGIWHILRPQGGSHIPTLRPKYIPCTYVDPLGLTCFETFCAAMLPKQPRTYTPTKLHRTKTQALHRKATAGTGPCGEYSRFQKTPL